ncbi:hypothetical protein SEA_DALANDE_88 [Gordonia phage DalanDe]|nr:hypothetical protein SEA_DALANDE_88 [Gordonia phage DalanDe]
MEIKDAVKTHTIKGKDLETVFRRAAQQEKAAEYIIYFAEVDITLTGRLSKGKG